MTRKRNRAVVAGVTAKSVVLVIVIALCLVGGDRSVTHRADTVLHDQLFRLRNTLAPRQPISDQITLVGIDDHTNRTLGVYGRGRWLTRRPFVDQLRALEKTPPKVLAFDTILLDALSEQEGTASDYRRDPNLARNLATAVEQFQSDRNAESWEVIEKLGVLGVLIGDLALSFQMSVLRESTDILLAYHLPLERENQNEPWNRKDIYGPDPQNPSEEEGLAIPYLRDVCIPLECVRNLPADFPFIEHRARLPSQDMMEFCSLGYVNVPRDPDGVVRRVPLVLGVSYTADLPGTANPGTRRFLVPSLALLSVLRAWDVQLGPDLAAPAPVEVRFGEAIVVRKPDGGTVRIPIDDHGVLCLDFVGRVGNYRTVSFAKVNAADPRMAEYLNGKIVIVGLTATGAPDVGPVPVAENAPLVLAHMTAMSNILTGHYVAPVRWPGQLALLLVLWCLTLVVGMACRPKAVSLVLLGFLVLYAVAVYAGVHLHWLLLPAVAPVLFVLACYIVDLLVYYITEERERKRIRGMFQTMVSSDVLSYMEEHPESFSLTGEGREATMFFSDVAGFTSISESLSPPDLVGLLNAYLTPMTEIIMDLNGYVDKYEGDAIMAVWGVPFPSSEHAKMACFAALRQQGALAAMRDELHRRFGHWVHVRMGLNSGTVSAGNMGSERRFSYTVMGDAVNQAARFEPANKDYGTRIMIGQTTYTLAKDHIEARLLDKIVVKGKTEPVQIYELLARRGELAEPLARVVSLYEQALKTHWERQFQPALDILAQALALAPEDGPCKAITARIRKYQADPPADGWKGEYLRTSKD